MISFLLSIQNLNLQNVLESPSCCSPCEACKKEKDHLARKLRQYRAINKKIIYTDKLVAYVKKVEDIIKTSEEKRVGLHRENAILNSKIERYKTQVSTLEKDLAEADLKARNGQALLDNMKKGIMLNLEKRMIEVSKECTSLKADKKQIVKRCSETEARLREVEKQKMEYQDKIIDLQDKLDKEDLFDDADVKNQADGHSQASTKSAKPSRQRSTPPKQHAKKQQARKQDVRSNEKKRKHAQFTDTVVGYDEDEDDFSEFDDWPAVAVPPGRTLEDLMMEEAAASDRAVILADLECSSDEDMYDIHSDNDGEQLDSGRKTASKYLKKIEPVEQSAGEMEHMDSMVDEINLTRQSVNESELESHHSEIEAKRQHVNESKPKRQSMIKVSTVRICRLSDDDDSDNEQASTTSQQPSKTSDNLHCPEAKPTATNPLQDDTIYTVARHPPTNSSSIEAELQQEPLSEANELELRRKRLAERLRSIKPVKRRPAVKTVHSTTDSIPVRKRCQPQPVIYRKR